MARYEFKEGTSNKFWEPTLRGTEVTTRYGKIGSSGQSTSKDFDSKAKAKAFYEKQVASKVAKGYALAKKKATTKKAAKKKTPKKVAKKKTPKKVAKKKSTTKKVAKKKSTTKKVAKKKSTTKKVVKKKSTTKKADTALPAGWKLPRLKQDHSGWTLKKPIPCWGNMRMEISLESPDEEAEAPSPEQVAALARLLTRTRDLRPVFAKAAFRYFKEQIEARDPEWVEEQIDPPVEKRADIWEHFNHWSASICCSNTTELTLEAISDWTGHSFGAVFEDFELKRIGDSCEGWPFVVN